MTTRPYEPLTDAAFDSAFPSSQKVYDDGPRGVRVPMRQIATSTGQPLRVYDASGPRGFDVHVGLPALRRDWIVSRGDVVECGAGARGSAVLKARPGAAPTQLQYA